MPENIRALLNVSPQCIVTQFAVILADSLARSIVMHVGGSRFLELPERPGCLQPGIHLREIHLPSLSNSQAAAYKMAHRAGYPAGLCRRRDRRVYAVLRAAGRAV